ncbi:MAG: Rad52/Rad22 family DNA repair protein [Aridibacter sp.]
MAVKTNTNNETEKRTKRAKSISAMGLVNLEGDRFSVSTPSLRGRQTSYEVKRDDDGKIRCNCLEFEEAVIEDSKFRCEHILAVKFALVEQNTESITKKPVKVETEITVSKNTKDENATELRTESKRGEQKADEVREEVAVNGQTAAKQNLEPNPLANTKRGKNKMTQNNLKEMPFITAEEAATFENMADNAAENTENSNNVLDFPTKLKALRKDLNPELIKQRQGWTNRNGEVQMVDYVEWHTVADILDETTPNWMHSVKDIRQIGDIITVTVALTIDSITREGIGTGKADSEMGIKKAEHDALKRAAVKFGIARELYKQESDTIEREGAVVPVTANNNENGFPANPIAKSLSDLVTAKQLGMIRAISREIGIDADEESNKVMNCRTDELSKRAASNLIQHLQDSQQNQVSDANSPMRRAG